MFGLGFILAFIGVAIALLIGILIFSEVTQAVNEGIEIKEQPKQVLDQADQDENIDSIYTYIGILPIFLFVTLFIIFRLVGGYESEEGQPSRIKILFLEFLCIIGLAKKEIEGK